MANGISRFGPPLALMALIFYLSAQPGLTSGLGAWDTVLRKGAHMVEFGTLALLWWRALGYKGFVIPAVIALGYAVSDEVHQTFVPDRNGSPVDVGIDAVGVAIAAFIATYVVPRRRSSRRRSRPTPQHERS